jgi:class 3 adenylate cyclase
MKFLFILLLCLIYPLVNAEAPANKNIIVLTESSPISTIKGLIWRDDAGNSTVEQVLNKLDEFKPVSEIVDLKNKYKTGTYWAFATFRNELNHDYLMRFGALEKGTSLYLVDQEGTITPVKVQPNRKYNQFADIKPELEREMTSDSRFTVAQISKGKEISIISKHIDTTIGENDFPIQYWDHVKFLEWSRFNIYFQGILLGVFVALSIFAVYYSYINKDLASIVYSLWLSLAVIGILTTQLYGGDRFSEFFINSKEVQTSDTFINYFGIYSIFSLSYLFLIFGIISLNLKINFPIIYKILVGLLIYMISLDVIVFTLDFNDVEFIKLVREYIWYIFTLPNLVMHSIFILMSVVLMSRSYILAFPLFLAALLHASVYIIPHYFSVEFENALPSGLSFLTGLVPYLCFAGQALIMACSIVTRIRYMQDQLNLEAKTHQEFVENQNRVLEETVAERTKDLKLESQKSERLMLNILPESIASRLKAGDDSISDSYQNATILFSDLVGFTKMSSSKTAEELVFLLNDLFKRFDTRATSLGLEKIKTIGDAYMVAGGLPTQDDTHAIQVTKMALGMYEDLDAFNKEHGMELGMRIGINSGPVVAGVIGHSKFSYDLWGNTVNTASRMESTCLPGKVQVSPSTYEQIKGHFDVQENQVIECKGLGQIMTYFVK